DRGQLELASARILEVFKMYRSDLEAIALVGDQIVRNSDHVYGDLARALRIHASDSVKQKVAAALREINPDCPAAVAAVITYDWDLAEASAAAWEKEYERDVDVVDALAEKY